jgi:membrane protease YdiL (CAAX protease family)
MIASPVARRRLIRPAVAVGLVSLLWIAYVVLQTLSVVGHVGQDWNAALGFVPGLVGIGVLLAAGLGRDRLYLRAGRISWQGFAVLAAIFVFALAAVLPVGKWGGWNWRAALILAPAGGVAQELFFRATLLPAIEMAWRGRAGRALILHSLLFSLWHIGPLFVGAPVWAVLAVMAVPFLSGIGWGWQVRRDRTVIWAMIQHSLIWVIALQFPLDV